MQTLGQIGETAAIRRITQALPGRPDVVTGVGDDCAVVAVEGGAHDFVLTSDPVVEGVHFLAATDPAAVGHKALGRVLSDIAAMGGDPLWVLVDVIAPAATDVATIEGVYAGLTALATAHGTAIVGGDVAEGPCLEIHVFGVGRVPRGQALLRSTAKVGDRLFVTGSLGGSGLGHHLSLTPRLEAGVWLRSWASAMIDVSDGLATDLRHLVTASHVTGELVLPDIPVSQSSHALNDDRSPLEHALCDGEDFELLFTVPGARAAEFIPAWMAAFDLGCTQIGTIVEGDGDVVCRHDDGSRLSLSEEGFSHFRG